MSYCKIDKISTYIYVVKFHEIVPTEDEFDEYLQTLKNLYESVDEKIVVIFDAQNGKFLPSEIRLKQAEWIRVNQELIRSKVKKTIFIITNPILEFLLESIFIIQKNPVPYEIVHSMETALSKSQLKSSDTNS